MISELIRLQSRAKALDNRLKEIDALYQAGEEDLGRAMRLKSTIESERVQILLALENVLEDAAPSMLTDAVQKAQDPNTEEQAKASLEQLAQERGWSERVIDKIKNHKGDIIDLIVSVAVRVAKEMAGMP